MTEVKPLNQGLAVVIGINKYTNGIPELKNAVNDAEKVAEVLQGKYGYQVLQLLDEAATLSQIKELLAAIKQQQIPLNNQTVKIEENDRFFFYFSGHGIAFDGLESAENPQGFLVPQDGKLRDEEQEKILLPMMDLHDALMALPSRHLLVILDCCFAGSFRWAGLNKDINPEEKLYLERYERFTNNKAQQVITSAAYDEKALDSIYRLGQRGEVDGHSPFAEILLKGLEGEADVNPDGAITATELYLYLQSELGKQNVKQTPGICQLKNHEKGEYIFPVPGFNPNNLENAPPLSDDNNPYRGLASFDEINQGLFFGRQQVIKDLYRAFNDKEKPKNLTAVLGASGTGKSSLVKAGLLPRLREDGWYIVNPFRPGKSPFSALAAAILLTQKKEAGSDAVKFLENEFKKLTDLAGDKLLLVIDQFEELVTDCSEIEKEKFLGWLEEILRDNSGKVRVIITLRSDFKAQFTSELFDEKVLQFTVPMMTQDEYREIIEKPATEKVLYFEPRELVEELINEVVQMPGALPLLSFTLSQLYFRCCDRWRRGEKSRAMTREDYQKLGGVMGALKRTATDVFEKLIKEKKGTEQTIRDVMLRMVAVSGDELARRRVPMWELVYPEPKNGEVEEVLNAFTTARLLVEGATSDGEEYVEPAHDALVTGWDKILKWKNQQQESLLLQRRLTPAAMEWKLKQEGRFLWNANPYLDVLKKVLKSDDNWFNEVEEEFVGRSVQKRTRNGRLRWSIAVGVSVVLALAGIVAESQRSNAVRERKIAFARQLAAESQTAIAELDSDQLRTLLAVESIKRRPLFLIETDTALRNRLSLLLDPIDVSSFNSSKELRISNDGKYFDWETKSVWDAKTGRKVAKLNHDDEVTDIVFSPDGKYLATVSNDYTVRVWNAETDKEAFPTSLQYDDEVTDIVFSPDGKYLATASSDTVRVWDAQTGTEAFPTPLQHDDVVNALAFSPDGKYLATASSDTVRVWDAQTGTEAFPTPLQHGDVVNALAFSPDGKCLATASEDRTTRIWDAQTGEEKNVVKIWASALAWSDSQILFTSTYDNIVKIFLDKTEEQQWRVFLNTSSLDLHYLETISSTNVSHDGKYLIATILNHETRLYFVRVWDAKTGKTVAQVQFPFKRDHDRMLPMFSSPNGKYFGIEEPNSRTTLAWRFLMNKVAHENEVTAVALSFNGKYLASAISDKTVRVWDAQTGKETFPTPLQHDERVNTVVFSNDDKYLATVSEYKTVRVWNARTGKKVAQLNHDNSVNAVVLSNDGKYLATVSDSYTVRVRNAETGKEVAQLQHGHWVTNITFSNDGKYLATASWDGTARVLDVETGKEVAQLNHDRWVLDVKTRKEVAEDVNRDKSVNAVAFSPDGKYLATASGDGTARVLDVETGKEVAQLNHDKWVNAVAFSRDGKYLATASRDGTARVLDVETGKELAQLNHDDWVNAVAFSRDGKYLATGSDDNTARVWDAETRKEVAKVNHDDSVNALAFSPDGKYLLTTTIDKGLEGRGEHDPNAWVHFLKSEDLIKEACRRLSRNLTADEWERYMNLDLDQYHKTCDELPVHRSVLAQGRELASEGDVKEAAAIFRRLLKLQPDIDLKPDTEEIDNDPEAVARELASQKEKESQQ